MSRKLMVFGAGGFIGGNLTRVAQEHGWEVFCVDNRPREQGGWRTADISDKASVDEVIGSLHPDAVVNVAAVADIDRAERERELAHRVNVDGARWIAESCSSTAIRYVFFSSDAVFDGERSRYSEDDEPAPINYYGRTKMEAEKAVLDAYPRAVVVRISLVLGFPVAEGNAFFTGLLAKLKEGKDLAFPLDEIRTPVDVRTLSECVLELCESDFSGIIHIGATGSISRYDLSKELARRFGYDDERIIPQASPTAHSGRAARHRNGILRVEKAQRILKTRLLSTEESIERALVSWDETERQPKKSEENSR